MVNHLEFYQTDTPTPNKTWRQSSDAERLNLLHHAMAAGSSIFGECLQIASTHPDGQIILRLTQKSSPSQRATLLLDFEAYIKANIDQGLTVWLEAIGDKNSLRNLRGIEVKQHD
jgi:hypothetical protein